MYFSAKVDLLLFESHLSVEQILHLIVKKLDHCMKKKASGSKMTYGLNRWGL